MLSSILETLMILIYLFSKFGHCSYWLGLQSCAYKDLRVERGEGMERVFLNIVKGNSIMIPFRNLVYLIARYFR